MSPPYQYTVDHEVLQAFSTTTKRQREKLLRLFDQLAADPFLQGDTTQPDNTGKGLPSEAVRRLDDYLLARTSLWSDSHHLG